MMEWNQRATFYVRDGHINWRARESKHRGGRAAGSTILREHVIITHI